MQHTKQALEALKVTNYIIMTVSLIACMYLNDPRFFGIVVINLVALSLIRSSFKELKK